jgi:hypothetical protein
LREFTMGNTGGESEGTGVDHALSKFGGEGMGLYPEVPEHGIRLPATQELDGVGVDIGTEEGGGAARAQGASRDRVWGDPSFVLNLGSSMTKGVGDVARGDGVPVPAFARTVVVERSVGRGVDFLEVHADAGERFARAEEGIIGSGMTDLLPLDAVLLVIEL